jgi:hypothetical protein
MRAEAAEKQIKPFIAVAFAGSTTFVDFEKAADKPHLVIGGSAAILWDLFGVDVDVAHAPGFFQAGDRHLVLSSGVTTVTGSFVLTLPKRMTGYSLRPYFVGGAGVMRVGIDDALGALKVHESLAVIDVGGGATGFVNDAWGVSWDVRYFRSFSRDAKGLSVAPQPLPEQLSFWRASMGIVLR